MWSTHTGRTCSPFSPSILPPLLVTLFSAHFSSTHPSLALILSLSCVYATCSLTLFYWSGWCFLHKAWALEGKLLCASSILKKDAKATGVVCVCYFLSDIKILLNLPPPLPSSLQSHLLYPCSYSERKNSNQNHSHRPTIYSSKWWHCECWAVGDFFQAECICLCLAVWRRSALQKVC